MIIKIADDISPEERVKLLKSLPVEYALNKFEGNRTAAAKFLNCSSRTIRYHISTNKNLHKFQRDGVSDTLIIKTIQNILKEKKQVVDTRFYLYASERLKERILKLLDKVLNNE